MPNESMLHLTWTDPAGRTGEAVIPRALAGDLAGALTEATRTGTAARAAPSGTRLTIRPPTPATVQRFSTGPAPAALREAARADF